MKWISAPLVLLGVHFGSTWGFKQRLAFIHVRGQHNYRVSLLPVCTRLSDEDSDDSDTNERETHEEDTTFSSCDETSSLWFGNNKSVPLTPAQESLKRYVESVKSDLDEGGDFTTNEGVECTGEPSLDPSRQVQSQGDSEWMDDW